MTITTGQPSVPWSTFKPCVDVKHVIMITDGIEENIGETTEEITEMVWNGKAAYQRIQTMKSEKLGNRTGIVILERETFAPLYYRSFFRDQEMAVEFKGKNVSGSIENEEGVYDFIYTLSQSSFDSLSVEMVLRVLPLELGYLEKLNAYKCYTQEEITVSISVVGEEKVQRGEGLDEAAWRVEVAFGTHLQSYWIGKQSRELLKQSVTFESGEIMAFIRG